MSFDRPRALSSLEEELLRVSSCANEYQSQQATMGENVIFKILQQRDFNSVWMNVDVSTRAIIAENHRIGLAARRQTLADTVRSCVVAEIIPKAGNEERLYEFTSDVDNRSVGILRKTSGFAAQSIFSISARRESDDKAEQPMKEEIDLDLGLYLDAFSMEDFYAQLPSLEDGSLDFSSIVSICKTIPWFDEYSETISGSEIGGLDKLGRVMRLNFRRLKSLYMQLGSKCASIYVHHWVQTVAERLGILNRNFPRGIMGFRALIRPEDPRYIRAILLKQSDKSHSQMMTHHSKSADKEREETVEDSFFVASNNFVKESKFASIPDLKRAWQSKQVFPRQVQYVDRNNLVANMATTEHECVMAAWSLVEIRQFLERLAVHAKNFRRVSQAIVEKSEKDCVDFYYRFKLHLRMKQLVAAGITARQDRSTNGYKWIIDAVMEELELFLKPSGGMLFSRAQLGRMNLEKFHSSSASHAIDKFLDVGDESPRRERKNAIMDILVNVIGRGYPVPPQLGSLVESNATSPALTPSLAHYVPSVTPRPVLSVVQTDATVLGGVRELQSHHTI